MTIPGRVRADTPTGAYAISNLANVLFTLAGPGHPQRTGLTRADKLLPLKYFCAIVLITDIVYIHC